MRIPRLRRSRRLRLGLLVLFLGLLLLLYFRWLPTIRRLAAMQADNETSNLLTAALSAWLSEEQIGYADLVHLETGADGSVAALQIDMVAANRLRSGVLAQIDRTVPDLRREKISVPVGNVFFPAFFSGRGADVPVRVVSMRSANAELESSFSQAGINQTLHSLELAVSVELLLLTPAGFQSLLVETRVPVAQTVIVGAVPSALITTGG